MHTILCEDLGTTRQLSLVWSRVRVPFVSAKKNFFCVDFLRQRDTHGSPRVDPGVGETNQQKPLYPQ
jgi:hypothetical protein